MEKNQESTNKHKESTHHTMGVRLERHLYEKLQDVASYRRLAERRNVPLAEIINEGLMYYLKEKPELGEGS